MTEKKPSRKTQKALDDAKDIKEKFYELNKEQPE